MEDTHSYYITIQEIFKNVQFGDCINKILSKIMYRHQKET